MTQKMMRTPQNEYNPKNEDDILREDTLEYKDIPKRKTTKNKGDPKY